MPKATNDPTTDARLAELLKAPLSAASLRAAADRIDAIAGTKPRSARIANPTEALAMFRHAAEGMAEVASGAVTCLQLLRTDMQADAAGSDNSGTVLNWASAILLVTEGIRDKLQDLEASISDVAAIGGAA